MGVITLKNNLENEIRLKHPKNAKLADYGGSRSAAIDLFCHICIGSPQEAKKCISYTCPIWKYRPGNDGSPAPKGTIPPLEEYNRLLEKLEVSDKRVAHGKKLAEMRKSKLESLPKNS